MSRIPLLTVEHLTVCYPIFGGLLNRQVGRVRAVSDVSFNVDIGESFGLVGESGSGKSTIAKALMGLIPKESGSVLWNGEDIYEANAKRLHRIRPHMQFIFQDPYNSLNPRMRLGNIVGEALVHHRLCAKQEVRERVRDIFRICGLSESFLDRFPHECSGGQRQRVGIARALIMNPRLIVADEPLSSLDVSIQAQIVNLFMDIQAANQLAYVIISHDLNIVSHLCNTIGVMYMGMLIEKGPRDKVFGNPLHPYTNALVDSIPTQDPRLRRKKTLLKGYPPSSSILQPGCIFQSRCPFAEKRCRQEEPSLRSIDGQHQAACHLL